MYLQIKDIKLVRKTDLLEKPCVRKTGLDYYLYGVEQYYESLIVEGNVTTAMELLRIS